MLMVLWQAGQEQVRTVVSNTQKEAATSRPWHLMSGFTKGCYCATIWMEERGDQDSDLLSRRDDDCRAATRDASAFLIVAASVNQDEVLIVARVGGRPGPRFRSMAALRR